MSTISRRVRFRSVRGGCVDIDQTVGEETPFPPARETDPTSEAVPSRGFSPSIPVDYGWKKAGGVIEPTFGPCRNFRDLEAIVSNCEAGGMSEFRTIFYWYRSKYHSASSSREKGESLSWSSAYANFVFLACEFFIPRDLFKTRLEDRPRLFQAQLSRDEAISWILSFVTGQVCNHKTVTSRMQSICNWFRGEQTKKEGNPSLFQELIRTYQPDVSTSTSSQTPRGKGTRACKPLEAQNHGLHPFIAYLLQLENYRDLNTALQQPYADVSQSTEPAGFKVVWKEVEAELAEKAKAAAKRRKDKSSSKTASGNEDDLPSTTPSATVATSRKRKTTVCTSSTSAYKSKKRKLSEPSPSASESNDDPEDSDLVREPEYESSQTSETATSESASESAEQSLSAGSDIMITPLMKRLAQPPVEEPSHSHSPEAPTSPDWSTTSKGEAIAGAPVVENNTSTPLPISKPNKAVSNSESSDLDDDHPDVDAAYALILLRFEPVLNSVLRILLSHKSPASDMRH